jgi:alpha-tubulin suppressor-like RCC1 family protein
VREVLAGSEHCLCLTDSGQVLAWGWNEHGNCGQAEDTETVSTPSQIDLASCRAVRIFTGAAHCFALTDVS